MKLNVRELKRFKANSAFIKGNNILPVCDYLKFENGTVTKSAMHEFVIQDIKCAESFLVDERVLMNFVDVCEGEDITVKIEDNQVVLSDKKTKVISTTESVDNFPNHEVDLNDQFELNGNHLSAISIAAEFTAPPSRESLDWSEFVHIGKGVVSGSDKHIAYIQKFSEDLPTMVLRRSIISTISKFDSVAFSQNEKYYFFEGDGCRYGFIKSDSAFFDMQIILFPTDGLPSTHFSNKDFIKFCDLAIASSPSAIHIGKMSPNKRNIDLIMTDGLYGRSVSTQILAENSAPFEPFEFPIKKMSQLLKSLPIDRATFYRGTSQYLIKGEPDFTAFIQGIIPQPQN